MGYTTIIEIFSPILSLLLVLLGFDLMTKEQAEKIVAFVNKYINSAKVVVCQCDGGVSRSSGTAAALSRILNGHDSWVFNSKRYVPNMFVYRMIMNAYYDS